MTEGTTPPDLRREASGRYWLGDYEIVRTGRSRWTLGRVDPEHVTTFGGGRDQGYALIDNFPTLADARIAARDEWINDHAPDTIAHNQSMTRKTATIARLTEGTRT